MHIYLDHHATTRPDPAVVAEMLPCLGEIFGNPSSAHTFGQEARRVADLARQRVAAFLGAHTDEIVFTSGGSEACNQLLHGLARPGRHIVVSGIEHPAVLAPCAALEACGVRITRVAADASGVVHPEAVAAALTPETGLVSVMLVNNDTGVIQPVAEIAKLAHARGVPVHTDAVQAAGKIPVDVRALGVDFLTLSAHKFNGPKGVGALYIRGGRELPPLIRGGGQENRRRAGTENLPGIAGFGKACELAAVRLNGEKTEERKNGRINTGNGGSVDAGNAGTETGELRNYLETKIVELFPDAVVNGAAAERVSNTSLISFPGVNAQALALNLDLAGVAISTGSACSSSSRDPSHVLLAMGRTPQQALEAVRFSVGPGNTAAEIEHALQLLAAAVPRLRKVG